MPPKFLRLLFVGAPGVGKGTYSSRAALALGCHAISSGDLLRKEVAEGTVIGKRVKDLIEKGTFVSDELITQIMVRHIAQLAKDTERPNGYILDGFPRNVTQAATLWSTGAIPIDHVVHLTQPRNVIITKLSSRRSCPQCGFVYNIAAINEGGIKMDPLMPKVAGVCDKCGSTASLVTRADDDIAVVTRRHNDYSAVAEPLLKFYEEKGILHEFPVLGGTKEYLPKLLERIRPPSSQQTRMPPKSSSAERSPGKAPRKSASPPASQRASTVLASSPSPDPAAVQRLIDEAMARAQRRRAEAAGLEASAAPPSEPARKSTDVPRSATRQTLLTSFVVTFLVVGAVLSAYQFYSDYHSLS